MLAAIAPMQGRQGGGVGPEGLLPRAEASRFASRLLETNAASGRAVAAIWIDVDRFRQLNDTFGHGCGDQLIGVLASRIQSVSPAGSHCFRMGIDEFLLLLTAESVTGTEQLAARIGQVLEQALSVQGVNVHVTASMGLHHSQPQELAERLLACADQAMFAAKRLGGNRFVWSDDDLARVSMGTDQTRRELAVASMLHQALQQGGLSLRYQPVLGMQGTVEAVEALMSCEVGGVAVSPAEFIPVAEKIGLIGKLGEWSLMEGIQCAARLHRRGLPTKVAINVSRAQLLSEGFLAALEGALLCADVPPQSVELELTESLFMEQSSTVQRNLQRIRETGVGLAIDDFGTGYSCLATLKDLPATKLKFDKAFIQCLPDDIRVLAIVRSMTDLAHFLGLVVVAEGVETEAQLRACEDAGLEATQGYLHARPMPENQLVSWLENHCHDH